MRKFTFIKSLFLAVALLAGNAVWGATGDLIYTLDLANQSSAFGTSNSYGAKSGTVSDVTWYANTASCQTTANVWLGTNSAANRTSYTILSAGVNNQGSAIASALGINTSDVGYYAIVASNPISNVGSIKVKASATGGTAPATLWCLYSTDGGTTYTVLESKSNPGTTEQTFTPVSTIASAQYAFVFYSSAYGTYRTPYFKFYEGEATTSTQVTTPQISATGVQKATDNFYNSATVTLSSTTDGASIYYTTNGDAPTTASTTYTAPFEITATSTIKAIATKTDMDNSAVAEKTITITELVAPTLTVTELTVPAMTAVTGLTDTETVNVSGAALTADILVTIDGADAAMFSVLPASIAQTAGTASGAVTVTYSPTAPGTHTATLKFNSTGATEVTRTLTGTSTMATPVAIDGSGVSQTGFTANWNAVAGATEYTLNVYTKTEGTATESNFGFEGSTALPSGWTGDGYVQSGASNANTGTYYAGMNAANKYIKTDLLTDPTSISFYYRYSSATANNTVKIQVSTDGSEWTDKGSYIATGSGATTTYVPTSIDLNLSGNYYIQFIMTSRSGGSFYFDDVKIISGTASSSTPIPGSPFTVTGETSKAITDLTAGTTYYYTVVAKNGSVATAVSNEIAVTTSTGTGLSNTVKNMNLRAVNGNIVLNAEAGQLVEVYNSIGQKVGSRLTSEGVNTIPARVKGVVFVKIGSDVSKLIME